MSKSNPARLTITEGDEEHTYVLTSSRPGDVTMRQLHTALCSTPGVDNVSRPTPNQFRFTMTDPPALDELAEELLSWLYH